ncbi:hypothetical protein ACHQM5_003652 [Ranunculus cassubicifolius]
MPSAEMSRSPIRHRHHHRSKSPIRKETSPRHRSSNDRHKRLPEDEDYGSRHRISREQERHRSREQETKERNRSSREHDVEAHRSRESETKERHRSSREHESEGHRSRESEKERHRSSREHEIERHRERKAVEEEIPIGRSETRSERDAKEGDSRSKRRRSVSPIDREQRNARRNNSDDSPPRVSRRNNSDDSPPRVSRRNNSDDSPRRDSRSRGRDEVTSPRGEEHRGEDDSVAKMKAAEEALEAKKKEEPSYELSGKLAAETNRVKGVTLLFTEPSDARKSDIRWRLYVFKGGEMQQEPLYIHRQTCYLFGRERRVADVPTDHPSCSKQHAVIQFRQVEKEQPDGMLKKQIGPYLMDLGSTNGTFLNETRIEAQRYYELFEKDTIKFGNSSREYVMLHENSAE